MEIYFNCPLRVNRLLLLIKINQMITQRQIAEITKKIVYHFHPGKIILFGSYAYGKPSRESDLDLLIIKDSKVPAYVTVKGTFS